MTPGGVYFFVKVCFCDSSVLEQFQMSMNTYLNTNLFCYLQYAGHVEISLSDADND